MNRLKTFFTVVLMFLFSAGIFAETIKVGVAWYNKSGMADNVCAGMAAELKETAPEIELEFVRNLADAAELDAVVKRFEEEKTAMVLMRSASVEYLVKNPVKVPVFFGASNDPVSLGLIKDAAKPDGNATGVSYAISYETQFNSFEKVLGKAKKVLLILEKEHPSVPLDLAGTQEACKSRGIKLSVAKITTISEAIDAAKKEDGKVDYVILGAQGLLIDNGAQVQEALNKTPCVSYTEKPVNKGVLCGLVADDKKLGVELAKSMVEVLIKGKAISEVPVKFDTAPNLLINKTTQKRLGIVIPEEVEKIAKMIE